MFVPKWNYAIITVVTFIASTIFKLHEKKAGSFLNFTGSKNGRRKKPKK